MLQQALIWVVMAGTVAAGVAFAGQRTLRENLVDTFTTVVVVGLLAQWLFRRSPGFDATRFWSAMLAAGLLMVALRWLVHG
jgi:hypothetical protein